MIKWKCHRLLDEKSKRPEASQMEVFLDFSAEIMQLQNKLDVSYHGDRFLKDQMFMKNYLPHVQEMLRNQIWRTSEQVVNWVAKHMYDEKRSTGTTAVKLLKDVRNDRTQHTDKPEAYYTLGKSYKGETQRNIKPHLQKERKSPPRQVQIGSTRHEWVTSRMLRLRQRELWSRTPCTAWSDRGGSHLEVKSTIRFSYCWRDVQRHGNMRKSRVKNQRLLRC